MAPIDVKMHSSSPAQISSTKKSLALSSRLLACLMLCYISKRPLMDSPSVKSLSQLFLVDSWSPVFGEVTRIAIIMFTTYFVGEMD